MYGSGFLLNYLKAHKGAYTDEVFPWYILIHYISMPFAGPFPPYTCRGFDESDTVLCSRDTLNTSVATENYIE